MNILDFINNYKYQILLVLMILLMWRIFTENLFLILLIIVIGYFIYAENK